VFCSVQYVRTACNWTSITLHSPHHPIDFAAFSSKPFLVAPPTWRCRPEKRVGQHPLYRRVLSSHRVDHHTVVVVTRKAWLPELYDGSIKVDHGPPPSITMQRRASYDWSQSYEMNAFNLNYDAVHARATERVLQVGPYLTCTDCYMYLAAGFNLEAKVTRNSGYVPTGIQRIGGYVHGSTRISAFLNFSAPTNTSQPTVSLMSSAGPSFRFAIYLVPVIISTSLSLQAKPLATLSGAGNMAGGASFIGAVSMGGYCTGVPCSPLSPVQNWEDRNTRSFEYEYEPLSSSGLDFNADLRLTLLPVLTITVQGMVPIELSLKPYVGFELTVFAPDGQTNLSASLCPTTTADLHYQMYTGLDFAMKIGKVTTPSFSAITGGWAIPWIGHDAGVRELTSTDIMRMEDQVQIPRYNIPTSQCKYCSGCLHMITFFRKTVQGYAIVLYKLVGEARTRFENDFKFQMADKLTRLNAAIVKAQGIATGGRRNAASLGSITSNQIIVEAIEALGTGGFGAATGMDATVPSQVVFRVDQSATGEDMRLLQDDYETAAASGAIGTPASGSLPEADPWYTSGFFIFLYVLLSVAVALYALYYAHAHKVIDLFASCRNVWPFTYCCEQKAKDGKNVSTYLQRWDPNKKDNSSAPDPEAPPDSQVQHTDGALAAGLVPHAVPIPVKKEHEARPVAPPKPVAPAAHHHASGGHSADHHAHDAAHAKHLVSHNAKTAIHEMGSTDATGLGALSFIKLKKYLKKAGIDPHKVDRCTGKPSLLLLAEENGVAG